MQKFSIQVLLSVFFLSILSIYKGEFVWWHFLINIFVITGFSNATNLTDGLDGLLSGTSIIAILGLIYFMSRINDNMFLPELLVILIAIVGFYVFNKFPAKVFMGDTGSLALGGALGVVSVITKHELVLAIVGGLFVLETISVIVQVASFKLTGKRIFAMAPLHHHFEKKGWAESTIVIRFWIIALILALVGLSTLKLR